MENIAPLKYNEAREIARKIKAINPKKIVIVKRRPILPGYRVEVSDSLGDCYTQFIDDQEAAEDYFRIFG